MPEHAFSQQFARPAGWTNKYHPATDGIQRPAGIRFGLDWRMNSAYNSSSRAFCLPIG
jgi:hypothetical protein